RRAPRGPRPQRRRPAGRARVPGAAVEGRPRAASRDRPGALPQVVLRADVRQPLLGIELYLDDRAGAEETVREGVLVVAPDLDGKPDVADAAVLERDAHQHRHDQPALVAQVDAVVMGAARIVADQLAGELAGHVRDGLV